MTGFRKAFIDTPIFIYLLEDNQQYGNKVSDCFEYCVSTNVELATSIISYMEFCVKPYEKNRLYAIEKFKELLIDLEIHIYSTNLQIADIAARLRGKYRGLKGMDALQAGTAIYLNSDIFMTNDAKLKGIEEINVILISDWQTNQ